MEYCQVGSSDLTVARIGFGAWAAGGYWWGDVDEGQLTAAIQRAFDLGITLYDTAPGYGFGHSEEVLGQALRGHRREVIIATKFGIIWDESTRSGTLKDFNELSRRDGSRKRILEEVDGSLRRLKTDYIDVYQQHWPDPGTPVEETMEALLELVQAGKVRHIGFSNYDIPLMERALRCAPAVSCQIPYSMLQREVEASGLDYWMLQRDVEARILPYCLNHGLGVLVWSPLQHGLLTGKFKPEHRFEKGDWRADDPLFQGERYLRILRIVEGLRPIASGRGVTLAQLAIAWTLMQPSVTCALVGAKRPSQVEENVKAAGWRLTSEEMRRIDEVLR